MTGDQTYSLDHLLFSVCMCSHPLAAAGGRRKGERVHRRGLLCSGVRHLRRSCILRAYEEAVVGHQKAEAHQDISNWCPREFF